MRNVMPMKQNAWQNKQARLKSGNVSCWKLSASAERFRIKGQRVSMKPCKAFGLRI